MKPFNAILSKTIFILIAVLSASSFVRAQKSMTGNPCYGTVVYVGKDVESRFVFELSLANLPEKGSLLRITDQDRILFEDRIDAKSYRRRYKIDCTDASRIYFEVINKKVLLKEAFQLNYNIEETWEVTKM